MQLCLINEIEQRNIDSKEWLTGFKVELALQSLPMVRGGMSMELDEFITSDERKKQVSELIDLIIKKINSIYSYITGSNLQQMRERAMTILSESEIIKFRDQDHFKKTVDESGWNVSEIADVKNRYQQSFELLKMLINEEMKTTASSPEDYWNW